MRNAARRTLNHLFSLLDSRLLVFVLAAILLTLMSVDI